MTMRDRLRRLPALAGPFPPFDPSAVPVDPVPLFVAWFDEALAGGVVEPHAMTVATVDGDGAPSARVVILKDVAGGAWQFATDARSEKARDLGAGGPAAASFYWPAQGRQVRVAGHAQPLDEQANAQDFLARSPASRGAALATRPGEPLDDVADLTRAIEAARRRVESEPRLVLAEWVVYALTPTQVEFWQGDPGRAHTRVVYEMGPDGWEHSLRWP